MLVEVPFPSCSRSEMQAFRAQRLAARGFHLPADAGWPNTGRYDLCPRQPGMLSLYARQCRHPGRLAKELKAYKAEFPRGLRSTQTAGLSFGAKVHRV